MRISFAFHISCVILFSTSFLFAQAQNPTYQDFSRLEAVGEMPIPLKKVMEDCASKKQDKQLAEANQEIYSLLKEGFVLYGDPVSLYLEKITDHLLKGNPGLREQVHVYALKSPSVNAFMTPNGFLFINIGLIAQSTSEAELAFVIAHELVHYTQKHGLEKGLTVKNMDSYLKYHTRSREMEVEADAKGFELFFKNAGYDFRAIEGVFDLLQYSFLPFDEYKVERSFFEKDFYRMDDSYFLSSVTPVSSREDQVDTFSTHPNMKNRRIEMTRILQRQSDQSGTLFILDKEMFLKVRTLARYETVNQQIIMDDYVKAFYNILILKQEATQSIPFLNLAEAASLYGIHKVKISNDYMEYMPRKNDTEGEFQFIANFFEKVSRKELALLCLRNVWQLKKEYPESSYLRSMFDDLVSDMNSELGLSKLGQFSDYGVDEKVEIPTSPDTAVKSKYDKIKDKRQVAHQEDFKTENYMLVDLKKDPAFVSEFEGALSRNEGKEAEQFIKKMNSAEKIRSKEMKTFLLFRPAALVYKDHVTNKLNTSKTIHATKRLGKRAQRMSKKHSIDAELILDNDPMLITKYQTFVRLNEFRRCLNPFSSLTYEARDASTLMEQINTPYLNFLSYEQFSYKEKTERSYKLIYSLFSIAQYPFLPVGLYQYIPSEQSAVLYFSVYDLRNNRFVYTNKQSFSLDGSYDMLLQVLYEQYRKTNRQISEEN